jgi:hypothetical protein
MWSPIVITASPNGSLTIKLTNNLSFPTSGTNPNNNIPTSLVIVGQVGGGLGDTTQRTLTDSPTHDVQGTTWPIANGGPMFTPPAQGKRVQSFGTEVPEGTSGTLTWNNLKPGTYLLESGTHPSIQATMGLVGMVVVPSSATAAYPGVTPAASVPMLFSEIDPVQNNAVTKAVGTAGFSESATVGGAFVAGGLGTLNLDNPGSGYTANTTVSFSPAGSPDANVTVKVDTDATSPTFGQVLELDLDPNQPGNYKVTPKVTINGQGSGAAASAALLLAANQGSQCHTTSGATPAACYPSVVNYTPKYYLINGVAFDSTNGSNSLFASSPATVAPSGTVLVRMVNAGSRMHIPAIVGSSTTNGPSSNRKTSVGVTLVAEDGNLVPGNPRVQSEVFMAAGKTYDVMIDAPASGGTALPIFDRQLSLSSNGSTRNGGMLAYIGVNGNGMPASPALVAPGNVKANDDTYAAVVPGQTLEVSDPTLGVIANDVNILGVRVMTQPTQGTLTLNTDGTFKYVAAATWSGGDSFTYCGNGANAGDPACANVTLAMTNLAGATITMCNGATPPVCNFTANRATGFVKKAPGILDGAKDSKDLALTVVEAAIPGGYLFSDGSFYVSNGGQPVSFPFTVKDSAGNSVNGTANVTFPSGSGLDVKVVDGNNQSIVLNSYRWIIEEDRTFFSDPTCTSNPPSPGCPGATSGIVPNFGTNFHSSFMPVIATGCTDDISCGNNQSVGGTQIAAKKPISFPADVPVCGGTITDECLDKNKRYFISVLPGDAAQPFLGGAASAPTDCQKNTDLNPDNWTTNCGHGMGGAPIAKGNHDNSQHIQVITEPSPYPPATLTVFVFEDDYPLNGEHDASGGVDILAPNEPGLGGFQITLQDDAGGTGDATGTPTYDMFNMPLSNSLAGTIDPVTGFDACPITTGNARTGVDGVTGSIGMTGMIITCPTYEAGNDASGKPVFSPLAGQAVIKNLWQGRYGVVANPAADRIGRGEEWVQTNTLDGQKAHDSFMRIGEPAYFQEFGPAGYHVTIGFANPAKINARGAAFCTTKITDPNGNPADPACKNDPTRYEVMGDITTARMSRTPDERLYGSGSHDSYSFTQCYVSLGDPDGPELFFAKCDDNGHFDIKGVPPGNWKITTFDQWNDQVVDGITTPVGLASGTASCAGPQTTTGVCDMGEMAVHQWQSDIYTRTFIDTDYSGVSTDKKPGLALVDTNIRFRDGSFSNFNNTDLDGNAGFNEVFPLFNWYVIETDSTRYKNTGTHVVYDAGGPADGTTPIINGAATACSTGSATKHCGSSVIGQNMANTYEENPLPAELSLPGSVYCVGADCSADGETIDNAVAGGSLTHPAGTHSTGRIDGPWANSYGWQGFSGQNNFLEFGKRPFADNENGGIHGHVVYASTRPFDDPTLLLQLSWEPLVPHVKLNLYKVELAPDKVTETLKLVDHTETTSFDDWAQGFRVDANNNTIASKGPDGGFIPNMNCPGQGSDTGAYQDPYYFFALNGQLQYLDQTATKLAYRSQYKCYDGMHNWNQLQPAPYDGMYSFPSVVHQDPITGKPVGAGSTNGVAASMDGTNCTICVANPTTLTPDSTLKKADPNWDPYRSGTPMLPAGKYVVEVVVPDGYELVKEEDKNILIGDNFIAPVTQQFGGLGSIFILPDQATVQNGSNPQNSTQELGRTTLPSHEADTGNVETFWPCVGAEHVVPDFISLYPASQEVAPFAGATRHLCDRKEVQLDNQASVLAKFYVYTETHTASHFTGVITDDFTAEFDPFSPQFGEKFGPAYLPVSFKDWAGHEIQRVYSDAWGAYNGLSYSTWEVNPPNPTGYGPTMMVGCMNDAGPVLDKTGAKVNDPLFQPGYSQFCYELPFMPGQTGYFDTPVVPTSAFAGGYDNPDCAYPAATPAILRADGDSIGPWVSSSASHSVASVTIASGQGGSGYVTAPTVTFGAPGTGGTRATGTAIITNGVVTQVLVTNPGTGYTAGPLVTFTAAPSGGTTASSTTAALGGTSHQLTITALGDQLVDNNSYVGPSAKVSPFNQQKLTRHYGFGSYQSSATTTVVLMGTDNKAYPLTIANPSTDWSDSKIVATIPANIALPNCTPTQQALYGGSAAKCGQLIITAANGLQSIDTVTVTIGGKAPTIVYPTTPQTASGMGSLQQAIDAAAPGDLLILSPGIYQEMALMWKPLRIQGVGAASSIIDANPHPAGKLEPWRREVVCLFGLALNGQPYTSSTGSNPFDADGNFTCPGNLKFVPNGSARYQSMIVDRIPMEGILGWDTTVNGNLAEQLIEPSLMGAYEGAGITVLGKGVNIPNGSALSDVFGSGAEAAFPTGTTPLTSSTQDCGNGNTTNPYPSNFLCNPSRIDGLTIQNSSQGGGAIWAHGWAHNLQIANNRLLNNQGTMSGGITIGQGEHTDVPLVGGGVATVPPGSCLNPPNSAPTNLALPFCYDLDVNIHHNKISQNSSLGDELFSSTPAGAGGATICNGSDYYKFNYNWVCGNMSTGDGAGVAHVGFSYKGDIEHNAIMFNQTTNPTIVTNGGGLLIMGAPDPDPPCATNDQDCVSNPALILPSDGVGPGLVINANLILGNSADSGSGGGLRLQHVNGTDVLNFPNGQQGFSGNQTWPDITGHTGPDAPFQKLTVWNSVRVVNNVIANNVAGIDGGGVSLLDALAVDFVNNSVIKNNSTATSGELLQTLFAPLASSQGTNCYTNNGATSCPQVAGLASDVTSAVLLANMKLIPPSFGNQGGLSAVKCALSHGSGTDCTLFSPPAIFNDLFWQNRTLAIGVAPGSDAMTNQQNTVTLFNPFQSTPATQALTSQVKTGDCDTNANFWDIGIRGDKSPGTHESGGQLVPNHSFLTSAAEIPAGQTDVTGDPKLTATYCNGSRVPPEAAGSVPGSPYPGWVAPPGTNESNALPAPAFTLAPAATVDEGNNWINLRWGPLSTFAIDGTTSMFNAVQKDLSPENNLTPRLTTPTYNAFNAAPSLDFLGNPRKNSGGTQPFDTFGIDAGAYEITSTPAAILTVTPGSLTFSGVVGQTTATQTLTLSNTGAAAATGISVSFTGPFSRSTTAPGTCGTTLASTGTTTCTINIVFTPTATGAATGTATIAANVPVTNSPVQLSGTAIAPSITVTAGPIDFGNVPVTTTSAARTLTVTNNSGAGRVLTIAVAGSGFTRATAAQGGAGSCVSGGTLNSGLTCTINVVFTPPSVQNGFTGSVTVTTSVAVTNSPVSLSGNGIAAVRTATLTPNPWTPSQTRNCPGTGLGALACLGDPAQGFTLTNTGNVPMTGIAQGALGGANTPDFAVVRLLSNCGPTGNGQLQANTTLAPGATCTVTVAFRPLTAEQPGTKQATVSVTDSFGTQTATITGSAN